MNAAGNLGGVIAPLVTGVVVQKTGSYVPAFLAVAVVLVVGIVAYTVIVPSLDDAGSHHLVGRMPPAEKT
jgi:nitrate/nitrite transporter NarK